MIRKVVPYDEPFLNWRTKANCHCARADAARNVLRKRRTERAFFVVSLMLILMPAGCGDGRREDRRQTGETRAGLCLAVPTVLVRAITRSLDVGGDGRVLGARAVRSRHLTGIYFVSARVVGPNLYDVGTWATTALSGNRPIYAVDGVATEFSRTPSGAAVPALSMKVAGAERSRQCVRASKRPHLPDDGAAPQAGSSSSPSCVIWVSEVPSALTV